jgi:glutamate-1-semialdehyde 2,1-aminomutase
MAPLMIAATMGGMPICLAAGIAAVKQFTPEMHRHLHMLGDRARNGIAALAQKHNVPLQVNGMGQFIGFHWTPTKVVDYATYTTSDMSKVMRFCFALGVRGVLGPCIGTFILSSPTTIADIDQFLVAAEQALRDCDFIK